MKKNSKIITFSRTFPSYHPRKGEHTFFIEGILTQLGIDYTNNKYFIWLVENNSKISEVFLDSFYNSLIQNVNPKSHTIRNHKRPLKVGEYINPHCWAGKPYNKTEEGFWQIKFAPDIEVKKLWDFELSSEGTFVNKNFLVYDKMEILANKDGLSFEDFIDWFSVLPIKGKIICWNESIEY